MTKPARGTWLAVLVLALLPVCVLHPCLRGEAFVPFDTRIFPPESLAHTSGQIAAMKAHSNFDVTEKTQLCLPELRLARDELARGRVPAWDPYVRGGAPLFAHSLHGMASPQNLPHLLMEPERAFAVTAWLAFALAGILMFGFVRELGGSVPAALFGGVVFAWSGTMAANAHFYMRYDALLWLPGMCWAIERLRNGGGPLAVVGLAVATAMTWTAGFPPFALVASIVAGVFFLWRCAALVRTDRRGGRHLFVLGSSGFALGLALAAVQLGPMLGYFPESQRHATDLARLRDQGLDPMGWLSLVLPYPFGWPAAEGADAFDYAQKSPLAWLLFSRAGEKHAEARLNYTEYAVYVGALPLLLAPFSVGGKPRYFRAFALVTALLLLVLSAGGVVTQVLYALLPPLQATPPMRLAGPVAFCLATSAALGFERVARSEDPRGTRSLAWLSLVLAVLCLAGWVALQSLGAERIFATLVAGLRERWGTSFDEVGGEATIRGYFAEVMGPATRLLATNLLHGAVFFGLAAAWLRFARGASRPWLGTGLVACELLLLATSLNGSHPPAGVPETPVHRFLREERDRSAGEGGFTVARVTAAPSPQNPDVLAPNSLVPERIRDLNSYAFVDSRSHEPFVKLYHGGSSPSGEALLSPLTIREYWFRSFPDRPFPAPPPGEGLVDASPQHPLFDLFGVRYLVGFRPDGEREFAELGREVLPPLRGPGTSGGMGTLHVFERASACPRAFVVAELTVVASDADVVARMVAPGFAPREQVFVTREELARVGIAEPARGAAAVEATVRFVLDEASHVVLRVTGSGGGYLLLADTFMSGWTATVDGEEVPIVRADHCFRAVAVPAGSCVVGFRYRPPGLVAGCGVSAVALLACGILVVVGVKRRRRATVERVAAP